MPPEYKGEEKHLLKLERYTVLPAELKVKREKLAKTGQDEAINPWVVTDIDFSLKGNPLCL